MRHSGLIAYGIAAALVLGAAYYGLPQSLGAHPKWSLQIAQIGVPIGLILAFSTRWMNVRWTRRILLFAVLLALSICAAHFGRLRFVASFADDWLAGKFWFFGWIGVAIFSTALISATLIPKGIPRK